MARGGTHERPGARRLPQPQPPAPRSLTTRIVAEDAFPLRVRMPAGTAGLDRESDVLVDQMLAWDNALFREEMGLLPEGLQDQVRAALLEFLDLA